MTNSSTRANPKSALPRRALLRTLAAAGIAAVAGAVPALAASKAQAKYQAKPKGGQRCGGCSHFSGGRCDIVSGGVSANGWCKFFSG